jgi:polyphosphate:AMP phosphotransferase
MFESAELGHTIDAATYDKELPALRTALLEAQSAIVARAEFPVIILVSGLEAAGKGEVVQHLHEWMDPRHLETHAMDAPNCVEVARPPMWRYWQALPRSGRFGVFFGAWYRDAMYARVYGKAKRADLERAIDDTIRFERMLTDEGALVIKFWLHLTKKGQARRLRALEKDRRTRWRVKAADWRNHRHYDRFRDLGAEILRRTGTQHAPWVVVEGSDARYRGLTVGRVLLEAMKKRLGEKKHVQVHAPPIVDAVDNVALLRTLDMKSALEKRAYEKELAEWQARLNVLSRALGKKKRAVVAAFEGPDASGKGGAIRRVSHALDARSYRVIPIAAPNEEERAHPYLWRFWRHVPAHGQTALFDRSWYGRVLVERVEGLCPEADWMRAYSEINDFEAQLARSGIVVLKFWLQVSKAEQLRRFKERAREEFKQFKLTGDDWRNRKKWDAYAHAACDMFDRTSTEEAPWTLVEADDKYHARVKVIRTLVERIEASL